MTLCHSHLQASLHVFPSGSSNTGVVKAVVCSLEDYMNFLLDIISSHTCIT